MTVTKNQYQDYLQSDRWKEIRRMVFERFGRVCAKCGSVNHLEVHHLRYPKILGEENLKDLVVMCQNCHRKCHGVVINMKPRSGVIYETWLRIYEIIATERKQQDTPAFKATLAMFSYAIGDTERGDQISKELEPIWGALLTNVKDLAEINLAKRNGGRFGGRPVNYSKNILKFCKKHFHKKYINDEVFKALERWFVYLSENNQATNLQVLESTIEKFSQNVDTQERLLEIIDLNIKQNNTIVDFDIFDLECNL